MKAFLSHSSKDKFFVGEVFKALGASQAEYDEKTFDYTFNVKAIRDALERSDLFVFFLSKNSIDSSFISEEQRTALELRGRGLIKQIITFALDETTYKSLPAWMRDINIVQQISSPKACARRIQSMLWAASVDGEHEDALYLGRDEDKIALRRALSRPSRDAPISLQIVGYYGVGRRTFLKRSMKEFLPTFVDIQVEITAGRFDGPDELYRQLFDLHRIASLEDKVRDFEIFSKMSLLTKCAIVGQAILEMQAQREFVIIMDDGGIYDDEGDYQPHIKEILSGLRDTSAPALGIIQTRMMPLTLREEYGRTYHQFIRPLSDEDIKDLLALSLKRKRIEYTDHNISEIAPHLDGHPFNVKFAVKFIESYGISSLTRDPSGLVEWKNKRAEEFLSRIDFGGPETEVIAALNEYVFLSSDALYGLFDLPLEVIAKALRNLEEYCCIERREEYYHITLPLRGAINRDRRFDKSSDWKRKIADKVCETLNEYKDTDHVPVAIIETAITASLKGADAPRFLSSILLPSHLLKIAREHYGNRKWALCIKFCSDALAMSDRLTEEGKVETFRLLGLSAVRVSNEKEFQRSVDGLGTFQTARSAKRSFHFIQGFRARIRGRLDEAETHFLKAYAFGRDNQSTNRELASLYCKQKFYLEAERYARAALTLQPTNPYILDIMAEVLLGKAANGESIEYSEVAKILDDLRSHGDAPGLSFFLVRQAHELLRSGNLKEALIAANRAVDKTENLVAPYFIRADIKLKMANARAAQQDIERIEGILQSSGGFSREDEASLHELKARVLSENGDFIGAKEIIERSAFMSNRMRSRANENLAKLIRLGSGRISEDLRLWADKRLSPKPSNEATKRPGRNKSRTRKDKS